MTDFTPTHRTNRAIGKIKAGSPIRVAQYNDMGFFSYVLGDLVVPSSHITYTYFGDDVVYQTVDDEHTVLPDDYVITDGEHFEVSNTDSGWDLLPTKPPEPEGVSFTAGGDNLYTLRGDGGSEITVTGEQLRNLAEVIEKNVSPIEGARFISARTLDHGEFRTLAKIDGIWYDHNGDDYMDSELLASYDEIEVIR